VLHESNENEVREEKQGNQGWWKQQEGSTIMVVVEVENETDEMDTPKSSSWWSD
jgi:hypothetical protein